MDIALLACAQMCVVQEALRSFSCDSISMWGIVTGASQGIGFSLLVHLAGTHPSLNLLGVSRSIDSTPAAVSLKQSHPNVYSLSCDLSTASGQLMLIDYMTGKEVAFIVHSAAAMGELSLAETTVDGFRRTISLMVETPLFVTKALAGNMRPGSRVLLVSSGAAERYGIVLSPAFSIAKAEQRMLYKALNCELQGLGVDVGIVNPGITDTPMLRDWAKKHNTEELLWEKVHGPEVVARFLAAILSQEISGERFRSESWNIYDKEQQREWVKEGEVAPEIPFRGGTHP